MKNESELTMTSKTIEIHGANAYKTFSKIRVGCRGVVIKDSRMLISHNDFAATNEEKRGAYLREYTALTEYFRGVKDAYRISFI